MSFVSFHFAVFFPIVAISYFVVPHRWRWLLLLVASLYFYASWIPAFLLVLIYSILISYAAAFLVRPGVARRRAWLALGVFLTFAPLFFFKYFGFVNQQIGNLLGFSNGALPNVELLLPIGISFYTFQAVGYLIDVYRGVTAAERNLGVYALFKSFFPQLVAGPIERSTHLLTELRALRLPGTAVTFNFDQDRVISGLRLILFGYFKKLVIADNLAIIVNEVYAGPGDYGGLLLLFATYCFAFQIYNDFSAYSDIARGIGRIFGIELMLNFDRPYQATSIQDFWRRWHISLTTWFRDYVYYPLGGSKVPPARWAMNILAVFLLSGMWHGANWTFLIWGAIHAAAYLTSFALSPAWNAVARHAWLDRSRVHAILNWLLTFHVVVLAWIFFRASSITDALLILSRIVEEAPGQAAQLVQSIWSGGVGQDPAAIAAALGIPAARVQLVWNGGVAMTLAAIIAVEGFDWLRSRHLERPAFSQVPAALRWTVYYAAGVCIWLAAPLNSQQFIYFQF